MSRQCRSRIEHAAEILLAALIARRQDDEESFDAWRRLAAAAGLDPAAVGRIESGLFPIALTPAGAGQ